MSNYLRKAKHQKDEELEKLLCILNNSLEKVESSLLTRLDPPEYPIIFIVGVARCGSTLLLQYMAESGLFSYPSNIISRFYKAPYLGAIIHKIFIDFDKNNEIFGKNRDKQYVSELGKTIGAESPNEFWYFWRRYFKYGEIQKLYNSHLKLINIDSFRKELLSIAEVFKKPLVLKGMIANCNISFLAKNIPNSYFIFIERDIAFNAQSLLLARKEFYGDEKQWYSFKPEEYNLLKNESPINQVVGQVYYTNLAIKNELGKIYEDRFIKLSYEKFCESPSSVITEMSELLKINYSEHINHDDIFTNKNCVSVDKKTWILINKAINTLKENKIE
jgi:hypothetical protein